MACYELYPWNMNQTNFTLNFIKISQLLKEFYAVPIALTEIVFPLFNLEKIRVNFTTSLILHIFIWKRLFKLFLVEHFVLLFNRFEFFCHVPIKQKALGPVYINFVQTSVRNAGSVFVPYSIDHVGSSGPLLFCTLHILRVA